MAGQTVLLREFTRITRARQIDEEAGVLYGLKILGNVSDNGREYPPATIERARGLYEGARSNANHVRKPGDAPDVNDRLGVWQKTYVEHGELFGDFAYFKSHPMTARLVEAARRPELQRAFGFSHAAHGVERREGSKVIIESIESVESIDLVSDPATVGGLYESRTTPVKKKHRALVEQLQASRPGYARALREMAEAGLMSPDQEYEEPAPKGPEASDAADHEVALKNGFRAAIIACLDDESLDLPAKVKKIKEILQMEEKMLAKPDAGGDAAAAAEEARRQAAGNLREQRLALQLSAHRQLNERGIRLTRVIERAVEGCHSEADVKDLVESLSAAGNHPSARSASPWGGGAGTGNGTLTEQKAPEGDPKKLAAWLRG